MNPLLIACYFGLIASFVAEVFLIWLMKSLASKIIMAGLLFKTSMDMAALPYIVDAPKVGTFLIVVGVGITVKGGILYWVLVQRIIEMAQAAVVKDRTLSDNKKEAHNASSGTTSSS